MCKANLKQEKYVENLVHHNRRHSTAKVQHERLSIVSDCVQDDLRTLAKSSHINAMPTVAVTQDRNSGMLDAEGINRRSLN